MYDIKHRASFSNLVELLNGQHIRHFHGGGKLEIEEFDPKGKIASIQFWFKDKWVFTAYPGQIVFESVTYDYDGNIVEDRR